MAGLRTLWLNFRDRCFSSERFHEGALNFPLTRPVVRHKQAELFDIVSGFVNSQVLYLCVELDLFAEIPRHNHTIETLSDTIGFEFDPTKRLVEAAAALKLLELSDDIIRLGELGVIVAQDAGIRAMVLHHKAFYADMADPKKLLMSKRGGTELEKFWTYATAEKPASAKAEDIAPYTTLMAESQRMVAREIAAAVNFSDAKTLLDVGGGAGAFLEVIGQKAPHLNLRLFDLPPVAAKAEQRFASNGMAERFEATGGSFFDDPLPKGADMISLVRILHDHDDDAAMAILKAVYDALPIHGAILIAEPMKMGGTARRMSQVYFNFYLWCMASGRPRSPKKLMEMLESTGFRVDRQIPTRAPLITSAIIAEKAKNSY